MSELENLYNRKRILEESIADKQEQADLHAFSGVQGEDVDSKIKELYEQIDKLNAVLKDVNKAIFDIEKNEADIEKDEMITIAEARRNVINKLGIDPNDMVITGGTLSSNASDSHLLGRLKTKEEMEAEMEWGKNKIKEMYLKGEISRPDASKLNSDLIKVYSSAIDNLSSERHV